LIEQGHIYVAQPPLFRVVQKKKTWYVQTEEEMKRFLMERGLEDTALLTDDNREIEGDEMQRLVRMMSSMEDAIMALERRGINLRAHAERIHVETGRLPVYHVFVGSDEHWFANRKELDDFLRDEEIRTGGEMSVDQDGKEDKPNVVETNGDPAGPRLLINEFHEVRTINNGLKELDDLGFSIDSLFPIEKTGEEGSRYQLRRGDSLAGIDDLRGLLAAIRSAGEKGMSVTRFKGLGEMNAEELRETTLDPENRTLLKVTMLNAAEADEMFRVLMGDKVEPRREFIEKHALEVRNLDI
jgi:DNA gyrase subunit B